MEPIVVFEEDCTDLAEDYDYGEEEYVEPEFITLPDVNYVPSRVREIVHDGTPPLGFRLVLPPRPYEKQAELPFGEYGQADFGEYWMDRADGGGRPFRPRG